MFHLTLIEDTIQIHPSDLDKEFHKAVNEAINRKYSNRVIDNVGLCISVYDIKSIIDPFIHPSEGCTYLLKLVIFRMIIFRPFTGEIIRGVLNSSSEQGITISVGFFQDIFIPHSLLQKDSHFDSHNQRWIWNYDGDELAMDKGDIIRCRVASETFVDVHPKEFQKNPEEDTKKVSPYTITCTIAEDGLGCVQWWEQGDEMEEDDDEGEGEDGDENEEGNEE
ncbi:DNA-directed RNA polymerase III subunit RPC8-like protein [Rozella allomycis CSF55]|uniref:DNA-directed RNA polymerase III subunit RPC8-like protein n=1 Tax=Rozella allomycis (strain CSF55) TaxID=988480 RepID=A0A075APP3_ROZAC|nr:RNA polymerase Rpb7 domain-containing protein [Rozella allomycis CSF55]RKP16344.1 DNA-directed RNA polymerase III subunit RPC8-like protein [Rozella allomycis CSF55]|eukprot:EPZ32091.1 RNA polymerase Rpb7 domain-containing protein [Rozella allomycis CSF55]